MHGTSGCIEEEATYGYSRDVSDLDYIGNEMKHT